MSCLGLPEIGFLQRAVAPGRGWKIVWQYPAYPLTAQWRCRLGADPGNPSVDLR